ncbi:MAG: ribonuclease HII [Parcubacteria group bacterium Gr01-1014_31]|nr:MAG: ribonuclease HII [Parcubacteria group bacterium Gr01-1014_31]
MIRPNFSNEKEMFAAGVRVVAGLDEVGRGAWAGPLIAGAVAISPGLLQSCKRIAWLVRDSKTLSERQRERAYGKLTAMLPWAVGAVSAGEIDAFGLSAANQQALTRAAAALPTRADFLLVDGRGFSFSTPHRQVVDGDARIFSVAAASIIAKVTRDRLMTALHRRYAGYGFDRHRGYGTPEHRAALQRLGSCPLHRRSYRPIAALASA